MMNLRNVLLLVMGLVACGSTFGQPTAPFQWSQFLGPNRDGNSQEVGLNLNWQSRPPAVLWKVELGGGFSSMSFSGRRLFTMTERGERIYVVAVDIGTGEESWSYDIGPKYLDYQKFGSGPRATPTFHQGQLFALAPTGALACLDAVDGREVWSVNAIELVGAPDRADDQYYWGMSASPLIEGNLVIVQPGGEEGNSVAAFHKRDGKLVWKVGDDPPGYGSPIGVYAAGLRQVICTTGLSILSVDPKDGRLLWRFEWVNKFKMNSATPVWIDGLLFISALHEPGAAALEIVREGDKIVPRPKWQSQDLKTHFATPIVIDGFVYATHGGGGNLRCLDLNTGEVKWRDSTTGKSSLIAVEGHLIALSDQGDLRLVEASPAGFKSKGEVLGVLAPKAWASPALSQGRLYIRDEKHLMCLDLR